MQRRRCDADQATDSGCQCAADGIERHRRDDVCNRAERILEQFWWKQIGSDGLQHPTATSPAAWPDDMHKGLTAKSSGGGSAPTARRNFSSTLSRAQRSHRNAAADLRGSQRVIWPSTMLTGTSLCEGLARGRPVEFPVKQFQMPRSSTARLHHTVITLRSSAVHQSASRQSFRLITTRFRAHARLNLSVQHLRSVDLSVAPSRAKGMHADRLRLVLDNTSRWLGGGRASHHRHFELRDGAAQSGGQAQRALHRSKHCLWGYIIPAGVAQVTVLIPSMPTECRCLQMKRSGGQGGLSLELGATRRDNGGNESAIGLLLTPRLTPPRTGDLTARTSPAEGLSSSWGQQRDPFFSPLASSLGGGPEPAATPRDKRRRRQPGAAPSPWRAPGTLWGSGSLGQPGAATFHLPAAAAATQQQHELGGTQQHCADLADAAGMVASALKLGIVPPAPRSPQRGARRHRNPKTPHTAAAAPGRARQRTLTPHRQAQAHSRQAALCLPPSPTKGFGVASSGVPLPEHLQGVAGTDVPVANASGSVPSTPSGRKAAAANRANAARPGANVTEPPTPQRNATVPSTPRRKAAAAAAACKAPERRINQAVCVLRPRIPAEAAAGPETVFARSEREVEVGTADSDRLRFR